MKLKGNIVKAAAFLANLSGYAGFWILIGIVFSILWFSTVPAYDQWASPSLAHPLGTDEFGRDVWGTLLYAGIFSIIKGLIMTAIALGFAILLAEIITIKHSRVISFVLRMMANIIEGVPIVLWVLIVLIVLDGPRLMIVSAAFTLVVFPVAAHLVSGEFLRLRNMHYVEAAYLLGVGELRVLTRYLLPNAMAVLLPFSVQILGSAIAVDGAIGVIGLGNRSDLDLGIFLLRGKEVFFLHPQILTGALLMYVFIYTLLLFSKEKLALRLYKTSGSLPE